MEASADSGAIGLQLSTEERLLLVSEMKSATTNQQTVERKRKDFDNVDEEDETLSFAEVRVMISAALLRYGSDYYPMSRYAEVFMKLEGGSRGVVTVSQLSVLLLSLNQEIDDDYLGELKQELDRGDGLLLFDDFTDLMDRLIDSQAELEVLGKLEDKGKLLRMNLQLCLLES